MIDIILIIAIVVVLPSLLFSFAKKRYKKRMNRFKVEAPVTLVFTKKGLKTINKLSKKYGYALSKVADIGTVLGFGVLGVYLLSKTKTINSENSKMHYMMAFASLYLFFNFVTFGFTMEFSPVVLAGALGGFSFFALGTLAQGAIGIILDLSTGTHTSPTVAPVIPGVQIPGVMYIPWYGVFSLIILIVIHEFSHGIMARYAKFRIKSLGLLLVGIIPLGAFVEPDEEEMKKGKRIDRLRVYSIASTMNLFTSFILFGFIVGIYAPLVNPYLESVYYSSIDGVRIICVSNCSKVDGLESGVLFQSINGMPVNSVENMSAILSEIPNGTEMTFVAGNVTFNTTYDNETGIGVQVTNNLENVPPEARIISTIASFLGITGLLNFAIGMMNFLPINVFDGGRIFDEFLMMLIKRRGIKGKRAKRIVRATNIGMTVFVVLLLLVGVLPFFVNNSQACVCI